MSVAVPVRSARSELRATLAVCRRALIHFANSRIRVVMALVQPLLFLFVLGVGLDPLAGRATGGADFTTFVFPGVLAMAVLFPAIISAASLVWDRELGFLSELLVAPVSRASILLGKCLGGAIVATAHGVIVLVLAGAVGVPYDPAMLLGVLALLFLLALTLTAFGLLIAVRIAHAQTFTSVIQLFVMPMFFASGAFFPLAGLPAWLEVLTRINPLTYAVDPMRRLVLAQVDVPVAGVTWFGWEVPVALEVGALLALGLGLLALAVVRFSRVD